MPGLVQIPGVQRFAVHHCIAVQAPGLAPRPGAAVGIALRRILGMGSARGRIVGDHMETAIIFTEVVLERSVGMAPGNVRQLLVSGFTGHEAQVLQVHHIVYDHRVLPAGRAFPGFDDTQLRAPAGKQALHTGFQHIQVMGIAGKFIPLSEAAMQHEAQVVRVGHPFHGLGTGGHHPGPGEQLRVPVVGIKLPQHTREEAGHPPAVVFRDQFPVFVGTREAVRHVFQDRRHIPGLGPGTLQPPFYHLRKWLLSQTKCPTKGKKEKEGRSFHI